MPPADSAGTIIGAPQGNEGGEASGNGGRQRTPPPGPLTRQLLGHMHVQGAAGIGSAGRWDGQADSNPEWVPKVRRLYTSGLRPAVSTAVTRQNKTT
ncbi:hypothetical protein GCM10023215_46930 [Pseudonocardia yuanmonensis]|uniref:Uncharacterized protein n=1 Tax=Pseudonocardia yuanmonensis TaxID=1095914 RepID=A0ABP8X7D9_9PSEU